MWGLNFQPTKTFIPEVKMKGRCISFSCLFSIQVPFLWKPRLFYLRESPLPSSASSYGSGWWIWPCPSSPGLSVIKAWPISILHSPWPSRLVLNERHDPSWSSEIQSRTLIRARSLELSCQLLSCQRKGGPTWEHNCSRELWGAWGQSSKIFLSPGIWAHWSSSILGLFSAMWANKILYLR